MWSNKSLWRRIGVIASILWIGGIVIAANAAPTLRDAVLRTVDPGSIVSTDELISYGLLTGDGYKHGTVKHGEKEWSYYDYRHGATHHTNHVESFWRLFKDSVRSTHIHISGKYMDRYLGEFTFRSNHRQMTNAMFDLILSAV